jgi:hypothetical protein
MEDNAGNPVSLGSGFLVGVSLVATNLHVIEGAAGGHAKLVGQRATHPIEGAVAIDTVRDLVILRVPAIMAPSMPLHEGPLPSVGDVVFAVGNPQGLEGTFSQGIVSGIRTVGRDTLIQLTAPISPGSSGGPVLNESGKVIGVAVATFTGGQNLNFALPASYLVTLVKTQHGTTLLRSVPPNPNRRSIVTDLGGPSLEGVAGEQFLWTCEYADCGLYSFSIRNKLNQTVRTVHCLLVFYDASDHAIDIDVVRLDAVIPPGLARRLTGTVDGSVQQLTKRVQFRVLDFALERP